MLTENRRPALHLLDGHEQGTMVLIPQEDCHVHHQSHHPGNCLRYRKSRSHTFTKQTNIHILTLSVWTGSLRLGQVDSRQLLQGQLDLRQ
jgi:hypothetical protein